MLTAFSTELLLLILDNLPTPTLLSVSRTSRFFHYLALPVYLSRHGISQCHLDSGELVLDKNGICALPGLTGSLFIDSLEQISCNFGGSHPRCLWEVDELSRFLLRLKEVKAVILDLGNIDSRRIDGLAVVSSDTWRWDFQRLLTEVVDKGCRSLMVRHGRFLLPGHGPVPSAATTTSSPTSRQRLANFLGRSTSGRATAYGHPLHTNHLNSLFIHSDLPFTQPFNEWLVQILNSSPIRTLSFKLSGLPSKTWSIFLSNIAVPSLSHFSAETADIAFADLMKFLSRHPTINTLNLHPHFVYLPGKPKRSKRPLLPQLASLSGSPRNCRDLLNQLPPSQHISTISISLPVHQRVFRPRDFGRLSAEIGMVIREHTPANLSLRFSVPHFMDDASRQRFDEGNSKSSSNSVHTLHFTTDGHFSFVKWIAPALPDWLAAFGSLKQLSFSNECLPLEMEARISFMDLIGRACPGARLVSFEENGPFEQFSLPSRTYV